VRRDSTALVAEKILTIFKRRSSRTKSPAERVFHPYAA